MAISVVTRGIAYFGSKQPLDGADQLDILVSKWLGIANFVANCALYIFLLRSAAISGQPLSGWLKGGASLMCFANGITNAKCW